MQFLPIFEQLLKATPPDLTNLNTDTEISHKNMENASRTLHITYINLPKNISNI